MRSAIESSFKPLAKTVYLVARRHALSGLRPLVSHVASAPAPGSPQNILWIRVDRIGDMVLSTPAFKAIKAAFPRTRLTVMASQANQALLKNNPHVDEVIVYDRSAPLTQKIRFLKGLQARRFDWAVDPYDDYELETAWIAWMSGTAYRIGYTAFGREIFLDKSLPGPGPNKHFVDVSLDLLALVGAPVVDRHPSLYLDKAEQAWAGQWLNGLGLQEKMLIAVHPGAYYETQRWPAEYFADLISMIRKQGKAEVILLGSPTDTSLIGKILTLLEKETTIFIESDIRRFLAILSRCRLLVCNNSGPFHCAAALHIPTISFMGPTSKDRWAPIGNHHHVLRRDDLSCIGCNLGYCRIETHECMRGITPEMVLPLIPEEEEPVKSRNEFYQGLFS